MRPGLSLLAFRRTLPPAALAVLTGALALVVLAAHPGAPLVPGAQAEGLLRFARRLDAWSVFALLGTPLLLLQAARLGASRSLRWLSATPASALRLRGSLFAGILAALAVALGLTVLAAEVAAGAGGPAQRRCARYPTPAALLTAQDPVVAWHEPALAPRTEPLALRLAVSVAPGSGPAVDVRWSAGAGATQARVEARLAQRGWLALTLPAAPAARPGSGNGLDLELRRTSTEGALLVLLPDGLEVLEAVPSERWCSLALAARALLALAAGAACAFGLATRMRPLLAAGVPGALWFGVLFFDLAPRWMPAGDLAQAWSQSASGLVPALPPLTSLLGSAALVVLGLAAGTRHGSRPA